MTTVLLAAGRYGKDLAARIAQGLDPRLDMFELRDALGEGARLLDFGSLDESPRTEVRMLRRAVGDSAALAWLAVRDYPGAQAYFTSGEDIGIPLALLLRARGSHARHVMVAHTLAPAKKRPFFTLLKAHKKIDKILCYASNEERIMRDELGIEPWRIERIRYHADERFFRPMPEVPVEPDLICSAGQLLRDYPTLIEATRGLGLRVHVAAGSPWIAHELRPDAALPAHVTWRRYNRFELRDLYARAAIAVVPIFENEYQTGISTILELMAMGKALIVTKTRGQTDTIIDGESGLYVPPGDPKALAAAIERLRADPDLRKRLGAAARAFVEREAGLDLFTSKITSALRAAAQAKAA